MSKIPSVADGDQLISDLTKKDFVELQGGGHRRIQYISSGTEEITPVRTKISRGTQTQRRHSRPSTQQNGP